VTVETTGKGVLGPVQVLRAIAASMVVVTHCYLYVVPHQPLFVNLGTLGVAIFFIISGFIMYHTCRNQWTGSPAVARGFFARRLHRIVPLYWLVTSAIVALLLVAGHAVPAWKAALSYLFIPYDFNGEKFRPVLGVGWTLDFEMFFYLLFAAALLLPKRIGLPAVLGLLAVLGLAGFGFALTQPIILLFGVGIVLGWVRDSFSVRMRHSILVTAALFALTPLALTIDTHPSQLVFLPGIWAMALAWAVPAIFAPDDARSGRFGLWLGDASYLLYLSHPLVVTVLGVGARYAGLTNITEKAVTAVIMLVTAIIVAMFGHLWVEKPLARLTAPIFGRNRKPAPVGTPAGAAVS